MDTQVQKAALVIVWMATKTFAEAAGVDGKQKWGLILSSDPDDKTDSAWCSLP